MMGNVFDLDGLDIDVLKLLLIFPFICVFIVVYGFHMWGMESAVIFAAILSLGYTLWCLLRTTEEYGFLISYNEPVDVILTESIYMWLPSWVAVFMIYIFQLIGVI